MGHLIKIFLTASLLLFVLPSLAISAPKLNYHTNIEHDSDNIQIKITIQNVDTDLDALFFDLPALPDISAENDTFNLYDYIDDFQAYTDDEELKTEVEEDSLSIPAASDTIYIEYSIDKQIHQSYTLHPDQLSPVLYFNDTYGFFWTKFLYLVPSNLQQPDSIHIDFNVPDNWEILAPFKQIDEYYAVEESEVINLYRHFKESGFYMGELDYYVQQERDGTIHKIARLKEDQNDWELATPAEAEEFLDKVAAVYNYFVDLFEHNPFPVDLWMPNVKAFEDGTQISPGFGFLGNGWHYWPEGREFEITCHMVQSWISSNSQPLQASTEITKGIGEYYIGYISSYELFNNTFDLAKLYYTYLVYDRMHGTDVHDHYEYDFMQGFAFAILFDHEIKEVTDNQHSIKDIMSYLYDQYALSEHNVTYSDLQEATYELTGNKMESFFQQYAYQDNKISAHDIISEYKKYFIKMPFNFDEAFHTETYGYTIPYFINIEITLQRDIHIMAGIFSSQYMYEFAEYMLDNHQIQNLSESDVENALTEITGHDCSGFFTRWQDSYGRLSLQELKNWLFAYAHDQQLDLELGDSQWLNAFYIAYWNRAADPDGLDYWLNELHQETLDIPEVAETFAQSQEAKSQYSYFESPSTATEQEQQQFVRGVYQNLLNREPDQEGLEHWVQALRTEESTPGLLIGNLLHAAMDNNSTDWQTIWNKIQVAAYYTQQFRQNGQTWSLEQHKNQAREVMQGISSDPSTVSSAKENILQMLND